MINSKATVFLQTASAYIFYDFSERNYAVKVLLDPRSQKIYISQHIADRLFMLVKAFGTDKVNDILFNEYSFSLM